MIQTEVTEKYMQLAYHYSLPLPKEQSKQKLLSG
jgi:hypothetical protein